MQTWIEAGQFTAGYDPREDRLRLVVNIDTPESRVDFWITRRFFLTLVMKVEEFLEQNFGVFSEKAIEDVLTKSRQSRKKSNEDEEKRAEAQSQPIPSSDTVAPQKSEEEKRAVHSVQLLETLNLTADQGKRVLRLTLVSKEVQVVSTMRAEEAMAFLKMLIQQAPVMEWGVSSLLMRR